MFILLWKALNSKAPRPRENDINLHYESFFVLFAFFFLSATIFFPIPHFLIYGVCGNIKKFVNIYSGDREREKKRSEIYLLLSPRLAFCFFFFLFLGIWDLVKMRKRGKFPSAAGRVTTFTQHTRIVTSCKLSFLSFFFSRIITSRQIVRSRCS